MDAKSNEGVRYVTCKCQYCSGHIEFDASHAGESVICPHCGLETRLISKSPPPILKTKRALPLYWMLFASVGAVLIFAKLAFGFKPVKWEKSPQLTDGQIRVRIENSFRGPVFIENGPGLGLTPTKDYLTFYLTISNLDTNKIAHLSTWRNGGDYLSDDSGNQYSAIYFEGPLYGAPPDDQTIYPGNWVSDTIVFEVPANHKWLHLQLKAANFGGSGMIRFEIPVSRAQNK